MLAATPEFSPSILVEGRSCWRRARANRVAFAIDGEAYFAAFAEAVERAERSVLIVGWDVHSRVRLRRDGRHRDLPDELGDFLNAVVAGRRGLHAHVLDWDFAVLFAFEREPLPLFRLGWRTHRRLHFRLDGHHPPGASQHQKIVVIDDAVAFVGGLDLAGCRWDTREHRGDDPRRVDPGYGAYPPFHDVQMVVDGDAAAALGALARERWRRVTGRSLAPPPAGGDPWPPSLPPRLRDVPVGIARTEPAWEGRPEVAEAEALYLDAIAAARHSIYLETQYLTSARIGDALAARLAEEAGPEVVVVTPRTASGWLEETTMGVLRTRLLRRLRAVDRHNRLRVYCPIVPGIGPEVSVNVHSKVLVVDDRLLRIGSSNVSNRSMRFDTECDLAVERGRAPAVGAEILRFRDDLVAEHLGVEPARVAAAVARKGSLGEAVEALRGGPRTLTPFVDEVTPWIEDLVPDSAVVDPERPLDLDDLAEEILLGEVSPARRHPLLRAVLGLLVLVLVAAIWRWTPLDDRLGSLAAVLVPYAARPMFVPAALGVFVGASLVGMPVSALIVVAALVLGPFAGFLYALGGALFSATLVYVAGRVLPRDVVRRLAGARLNGITRRLTRGGALGVARLRLVPSAPFRVVSLVAGAARLRPFDFLLGTLLVLLPGSAGIAFVSVRLAAVLSAPDGYAFQALVGIAGVTLLLLAATWIRRRVPVRSAPGV